LPTNNDLFARIWPILQSVHGRSPNHTVYASVRVFKSQIYVSASVDIEVAQLPFDPHADKAAFEDLFDLVGQLSDAERG
tara:strand:- start:249 stop:485 length:237 start_codon:yes stop_codon:yes gene_type:complete